jgi:hypothetical protein
MHRTSAEETTIPQHDLKSIFDDEERPTQVPSLDPTEKAVRAEMFQLALEQRL